MNVAIIGGGASGLFAAAVISKYCNVVVFEKNEKVGKKIYITGKGRCNFTNNCSVDEFLENVIDGKKFLQSALRSFPPQKTLNFFEDNSMQYVVERGNRAFPRSMKASDVTKTLVKVISDNNGEIRCNCKVYDVTKSQRFALVPVAAKKSLILSLSLPAEFLIRLREAPATDTFLRKSSDIQSFRRLPH